MGAESLDAVGYEKLCDNIEYFKKNIKRFKEGFNLTIERNIKNKIITDEEAMNLMIELNSIKY